MSATKISNANYLDNDWQSEIISKNLLKKGFYNISLTTSDAPEIASGSAVDVDGVLYLFESDESVVGTPSQGTNYITITDVASVGVLALTNDPLPDWDNYKLGYYSGLTRYIAKFIYTGTTYSDKELLDDKFRFKISSEIIKQNNEIAELTLGNIVGTQIQLVGTDTTASDQLGQTSAIAKDIFVSTTSSRTSNTGVAYVWYKHNRYGYSNWSVKAKLVHPSAATNQYFGYSCDISSDGNYIAIGAIGYNGGVANQGCVVVFHKTSEPNTWDAGTIIVSPSPSFETLGSAVKFVGNDQLIMGAYGYSSNIGTAYTVSRTGTNTWGTPVEITATGKVASGTFGNSIDVYGRWLVIGAGGSGAVNGKIFIYENVEGTWTQRQTFEADPTIPLFGIHVSIYGDYIAVSSKNDNTGATAGGAVYIYKNIEDTWTYYQKLVPSDVSASQTWAESGVKLWKNWLIVGQEDNDVPNTNQGAIYIYRLTDGYWQSQTKISATGGIATDTFGTGLALNDDNIIVGCRLQDVAGSASGCVYVYKYLGGV